MANGGMAAPTGEFISNAAIKIERKIFPPMAKMKRCF
jgi:hypothetical protein